ncbi:MAG: thiamine-monophosphate kinase, partial [Planctomycetaceae bacterium]
AQESGRTPLEHALGDGEDFELVGTVPGHQAAELAASGLAVCVGEIVERGGLWLKHPDGTEQPLPLAGWKHGFTPPAEGPR